MEGISRDVYDYLYVLETMTANDYKYLVSKYGKKVVHSTIDYMIDESQDNISKFDYYIDKLIGDIERDNERKILHFYMHDIGKTPRLNEGDNEIYGSMVYDTIGELKKLFDLMDCKYIGAEKVICSSIIDDCKFYMDNCSDLVLLEQLKELYNKFIYLRDILVEGNIRLVVATLKNYYRDPNSFMEVIQWGNVGLMHAVERYNPNFNVKFVTYAYYWIRQSIRHTLKFEFSSITTVSYAAVEKNAVRLKTVNNLTNKLGRKPSLNEVADSMGISKKSLKDIEDVFVEPISLSKTLISEQGNETNTTVLDLFEDINSDVEKIVCDKMLRVEILKILNDCLSEQQRNIILSRFGFYGEPLSFEQIGEKYGVSKQYIQQTQKRSLARIRQLAGKKLEDFL